MSAPLTGPLRGLLTQPPGSPVATTGSGTGPSANSGSRSRSLTPSRVPTIDVTPSTQEMQVVKSQQVDLRPQASTDSDTVNTTATDPHAQPEPLAVGRYFGGFAIRAELGRGGMGVVYRADDQGLARIVAIKVLINADSDGRRRFLREARLAAGLNHPNIVTVHQIAEDGGLPFIVTEYLPNGSIEGLIKKLGPMPPATALRATVAAGRALAFAHQRKIIHRDVKPANLLVAEDGTVKLGDFGISKSLGEASRTIMTQPLTGDGSLVGTPQFISPEQWCGQPGSPSGDQYALGCTLFYLLTGRNPFQGAGVYQIFQKHIHQPLPDVRTWMAEGRGAGLPDELHELLSRSAAKRAEDRFANLTEFAERLERLAARLDPAGRQTVATWIGHVTPPGLVSPTARPSVSAQLPPSQSSEAATVQPSYVQPGQARRGNAQPGHTQPGNAQPGHTQAGTSSKQLTGLSTRTAAPALHDVVVPQTPSGTSSTAIIAAAAILGVALVAAAVLMQGNSEQGRDAGTNGLAKVDTTEKRVTDRNRTDGSIPVTDKAISPMMGGTLMGSTLMGSTLMGSTMMGTTTMGTTKIGTTTVLPVEPPVKKPKTDPMPKTTAGNVEKWASLRGQLGELLRRTASGLSSVARPVSEELTGSAATLAKTWSAAAGHGERLRAVGQLSDALSQSVASGNPSRLAALLDRVAPAALAERCELLRVYGRVTLLPPKEGLPPMPADGSAPQLIVGWRLLVTTNLGTDNRALRAELPLVGPLELSGKPTQRRWSAERLVAALPDPVGRERAALQAAVDDLISLDANRYLARLAQPNSPAGNSIKIWLDWLSKYRDARKRSGSDLVTRSRLLSVAVFPPSEDAGTATRADAQAAALVLAELRFGDRPGGSLLMHFVKVGSDWKLAEQRVVAPAK